jgi:predicted nucleic acid-binding protein
MTRSLVLFDTSVYIPYLRGEAYSGLIEDAVRRGMVRPISVVMAELYAGTRSAQDKADLDVVLRAYQSLGFLVTPQTYGLDTGGANNMPLQSAVRRD